LIILPATAKNTYRSAGRDDRIRGPSSTITREGLRTLGMVTIKNIKLYKGFSKDLILLVLIPVSFLLSLSCCGKKAPPIPPSQTQPPTVDDLGASIDRDELKLTWTIPKEKENVTPRMSGFIVYRAKTPLSESDCEDCPVLFERVADIPIEMKGSGNLKEDEMTYDETLEKGYRYIYKVTSYSKGATGNDSNYVDLIH
jgi:hypothetical protein